MPGTNAMPSRSAAAPVPCNTRPHHATVTYGIPCHPVPCCPNAMQLDDMGFANKVAYSPCQCCLVFHAIHFGGIALGGTALMSCHMCHCAWWHVIGWCWMVWHSMAAMAIDTMLPSMVRNTCHQCHIFGGIGHDA